MSSLSFLSHIKPLPFSPGYCSDSSPVQVLRSQIHHCTIALPCDSSSQAGKSCTTKLEQFWPGCLEAEIFPLCSVQLEGESELLLEFIKNSYKGNAGLGSKGLLFLLFCCFLKMTRNTWLSKRAEAVDPSSDSARKTNKPGIVFHVHARAPGRIEPLLREWFSGISLSK